MLKGWLDRVWATDVAFTLPADGARIVSLMTHVKRIGVVTTCGAPWWWSVVIGQPGRKTILRGMRALCARRCRTLFLAHYDMDRSTRGEPGGVSGEVKAKLAAAERKRPLQGSGYPHPFRLRIVHRLQRRLGGKALAGDLDLVGRGQHVGLALARARHVAEPDGAAEMVAVIARGDGADDRAVADDRLVVEEQRLGIVAGGTAPAGAPARPRASSARRRGR